MVLCIIMARSFNHIHTFHNLNEFINEIWSLLDVIIDYGSSSIPNVLWIIRSLIYIMSQAFFNFGIFLLLYCNVPKTTMIKRFSLSACLALKGISHDIWYDYGIGYYQTQTWILCKHKNYSTIGLSLNTSSLRIIKDYRCSIKAYSNTCNQLIGAQIHSKL